MNASVKGGCAPPEPCKPPTEAEIRRDIIARRIEGFLEREVLALEHHRTLTKVLAILGGPLVPEEKLGTEIVAAIRAAIDAAERAYDKQTLRMALVEIQVIVGFFARTHLTWP